MNYVSETLIPLLKHENPNDAFTAHLLKRALWYSLTEQAYIQRSSIFDSTWLSTATSDVYVSLFLKETFNVPEIQIYSKTTSCNVAITRLKKTNASSLLFMIARDKKSLFINFWERLRNTFAHGAVNSKDGITYLMNQYKPKPDADVNFLIQTDVEIDAVVSYIWETFSNSLSDVSAFKYQCLKRPLMLEQHQNYYHSMKTKRRVIIDDRFRFETEKRVQEMKEFINSYLSEGPADIIISENIGRISDKNLTSEDGSIKVIPQTRILEALQIEGVSEMA